MLNNFKIGRYYFIDSYLHRLSPVFKILSVIIVLICLIFAKEYIEMVFLLLYLMLAMLCSNINFKVYLKSIWNLKIFLIFIVIIDLISNVGLNKLIYDIYLIIYIVLYTSILLFTTKTSELNYAILKILKPFDRIIDTSKIALSIMLSLNFIPLLMLQIDRIIKAQSVRGVNYHSKNIREKLMAISSMFIPMFIISLKKADEVSDVMSLKLYGYVKERTNYEVKLLSYKDVLLFMLNVIMLIIVIMY